MSNVREATAIDPAPTITVHISSLMGLHSADMEILPDSGADVSAAGKEALRCLGEQPPTLQPEL